MSEIRVTSVVGENGGDRVGLTTGLTVGPLTGTTGIGATISHQGHAQFAGVCTATSFSGSGASLTGLTAGITMVDQYFLSVQKTASGNAAIALDSDFVRVSGTIPGAGHIGTGMTKNGEIFSFPSTGIYSIHFRACVMINSSSTGQRYAQNPIFITTNNSSYNNVAMGLDGVENISGESFGNPIANFIFDVTDTSTHKCKFNIQSGENGWTAYVRTNRLDNVVTFTRLGDT